MMETPLLSSTEAFATQFATTQIDATHHFHAPEHVDDAARFAVELAAGYRMPLEQIEEIGVAMWFHDLGFSEGWRDHELRSADLATTFLNQAGVSQDRIDRIRDLIMVTNRSQPPDGLAQEIVLDADTVHLGQSKYFDRLNDLRREWEATQNRIYTDEEWLTINLEFIRSHQFFTELAEARLGRRKRKNLESLEKMWRATGSKMVLDLNENIEESMASLAKEAGRGVETMFRVTLRNQNHLSGIADNKANIMLSINAIMLSIIISTLVPQLGDNRILVVPTLILVVVCIFSIVLATLSVRPDIRFASYDEEKFLTNKYNILFFGNFRQLPIEKFDWAIRQLLRDPELLYGSLSKDLYYVGLVLDRKFRYLRLCYNVFMVGLVITAMAYLIAFLLGNNG